MVLDGTVVAVGEGGLPRRRLLQRRTATARPSPAVVRRTPVGFVVGDLLWLAGPRPRRPAVPPAPGAARGARRSTRPPVVVSPSFPVTEAEAVMRTAEEYGAEALHAKHLDAPYRPGRRSRAWLRVPLRRSGLVVVGGWNPAGPAAAATGVAALLLGVPVPEPEAAGCGTSGGSGSARGRSSGRSRRCSRVGVARRRRSRRPLPPAVAATHGGRHPGLVGRVEFTDWTADGRLRLPAWRGLRQAATRPDSGRCCGSPPRRTAGPSATRPCRARTQARRAAPAAPTVATASAGWSRRSTPQSAPATRAVARPVEARRLEQHFVYNALNTIAALMRTDPGRARELLLGFADLNRAADRPEGTPGTLGDELDRGAGLPAARAGPVRPAAAGGDRRRRGGARRCRWRRAGCWTRCARSCSSGSSRGRAAAP